MEGICLDVIESVCPQANNHGVASGTNRVSAELTIRQIFFPELGLTILFIVVYMFSWVMAGRTPLKQ
jgi:hypothetical protein